MGGGQIHSQIGPIKIDIEIKLMPTFADSGVLLATVRENRCCNKNILFFRKMSSRMDGEIYS